jgi:hypothetical protein
VPFGQLLDFSFKSAAGELHLFIGQVENIIILDIKFENWLSSGH